MSVYLSSSRPRYLKLTLVFILASAYLGIAIATEEYLTSAVILIFPAILFLSTFQLLLILLAFLQINSQYLPAVSVGPLDVRLSDLFISLIMAKVFLDLFVNEGNIFWRNWRIPKDIKVPLFFFILFCLITQVKFLILDDSSRFIGSMVSYSRFLTNVALLFIIPVVIRKESQLKTFVILMLIFIILQACLGTFQYFTGLDIFGTVKGSAFRQGRISGLLYEPASYGLYIMLGLFLCIGIFMFRLVNSVIISLGFLVLLLGLIFSQSRTSWLAFAAVLPVIAWEFNVRGKAFISILIFLVVMVVGFVYFDLVRERVVRQAEEWSQGYTNNSYAGRWQAMKTGLIIGIERNYMLGSGWNTFQYERTNLNLQNPVIRTGTDVAQTAHSAYIQIFSDMGIFALIAFIAVLYKSLMLSRNIFEKANNNLWKATALGIFLWLFSLVFWFISGQLVAGTTQSNFLWLSIGILICINRFLRYRKDNVPVLREDYNGNSMSI